MTSERSDFAPLKQLLDELMMSPTRQGPPMEVDASAVRFMLKRNSIKGDSAPPSFVGADRLFAFAKSGMQEQPAIFVKHHLEFLTHSLSLRHLLDSKDLR